MKCQSLLLLPLLLCEETEVDIEPEVQKAVEDYYRKRYALSGKDLDETMEAFNEAQEVARAAGGRFDQYKNQAEARPVTYEKALRRAVRLVRSVRRIIASKRLSPSHIEWDTVWSQYKADHPQDRMKSPAVLKTSYHRALGDPRVKKKLFDKDYTGDAEPLKEIVLHEEDPVVAEMALKAALYDVAQEYGDVVLSGTVIAMRVRAGLPVNDESVVSFGDPAKETKE